MDPWLLLPRILLFLDTLRPRDTVGSKGVAAVCSGFWARSWGLVTETASVSLRILAFFFPPVTNTFPPTTPINLFRLLTTAPPVPSVKVS